MSRVVLADPPSPREQVRLLREHPCPVCGVVEIVPGDAWVDELGTDVDDDGLVTARCACGEAWTLTVLASAVGVRTAVKS